MQQESRPYDFDQERCVLTTGEILPNSNHFHSGEINQDLEKNNRSYFLYVRLLHLHEARITHNNQQNDRIPMDWTSRVSIVGRSMSVFVRHSCVQTDFTADGNRFLFVEVKRLERESGPVVLSVTEVKVQFYLTTSIHLGTRKTLISIPSV